MTLCIWLKHGTDIAALRWMGANVDKDARGWFIHVTHPQHSPLPHLLSKEAVKEVELRDFVVDEMLIADGWRIKHNAFLYALTGETRWLDGNTHLIQHIVARGRNIRDVMEIYFIALQAKEVAAYNES